MSEEPVSEMVDLLGALRSAVEAAQERRQFVAHVHGCKLPPDHKDACLSDTPHQFGGHCEHCHK